MSAISKEHFNELARVRLEHTIASGPIMQVEVGQYVVRIKLSDDETGNNIVRGLDDLKREMSHFVPASPHVGGLAHMTQEEAQKQQAYAYYAEHGVWPHGN